MTNAYRRPRRVAAVAAVATIGLAACGGSSNAPHVASLGTSVERGSTTTTTLLRGNPTQLLDEWAACMRTHGEPGQVDPTIDANGVIHITVSPGNKGPAGNGPVALGTPSEGVGKGGAGANGGGPCDEYLTAASTALRGGKPLPQPDPAKLEKYSQCMRAHGLPDFPDPSAGGLSIQIHPGSDLNPRSPTFQSASKTCAKSAGVPGFGGGTPPRGAIEATTRNAPAGGPGGNGGASFSVSSGGGGG
jgi:hypothetical protein